MVLFKINGERNSGTNFLFQILKMNGFSVYDQEIQNNICFHWKHGIPRNDCKQLNDRVIDIFIFRELNEWLISMYANPYHLKKYYNFKNFLTLPQHSQETHLLDYKTNQCLNNDDKGKTIFQIRYYKFNKICEYKDNNNDIIFVKLSYLQNEKNLLHFLQTLNSKYLNNPVSNYITSIKHTKSGENKKNRKYNINIQLFQNFINNKKNIKIENFINDLEFTIK
jgi:hypothetical protein